MPDQILSINKIKLNNVLGAELSRFETIIRSYLTIQSSFVIISLVMFTFLINKEIIILIFSIIIFILIIVFLKKS